MTFRSLLFAGSHRMDFFGSKPNSTCTIVAHSCPLPIGAATHVLNGCPFDNVSARFCGLSCNQDKVLNALDLAAQASCAISACWSVHP
jgi:hypothetical protein